MPGWPMTIRGGGDPSQNMVIEPFVRMGPPPRSLAAEANDCFMVRTPDGVQPNTRVRREFSRANGGLPSVRFLSHALTSSMKFSRRRDAIVIAISTRMPMTKSPYKFWPQVDDGAVIVPPRSTAASSGTAATEPTQRDRYLEGVAEKGRIGWQKPSGYNKRSRVEGTSGRCKQVICDRLCSRKDKRRTTEVGAAVQCPEPNAEFRMSDLRSHLMNSNGVEGLATHAMTPHAALALNRMVGSQIKIGVQVPSLPTPWQPTADPCNALGCNVIGIRALRPARMFDMSNLSVQRTNFIALAEISYSLATTLCFTPSAGV